MCRSAAEGGQRCASHTRVSFQRALMNLRNVTRADPEAFGEASEVYRAAAVAYASTPEGQEVFQKALDEAEASEQVWRAGMAESILLRGRQLREHNREMGKQIRRLSYRPFWMGELRRLDEMGRVALSREVPEGKENDELRRRKELREVLEDFEMLRDPDLPEEEVVSRLVSAYEKSRFGFENYSNFSPYVREQTDETRKIHKIVSDSIAYVLRNHPQATGSSWKKVYQAVDYPDRNVLVNQKECPHELLSTHAIRHYGGISTDAQARATSDSATNQDTALVAAVNVKDPEVRSAAWNMVDTADLSKYSDMQFESFGYQAASSGLAKSEKATIRRMVKWSKKNRSEAAHRNFVDSIETGDSDFERS